MAGIERDGIGFVGLGVMGEPMCRNLARKSGRTVYGFDRDAAPMQRLADHGVIAASGLQDLAERCEVIFLSLPSAEHLKSVCEGPAGLIAQMQAGQILVDTSTSPVELTRTFGAALAAKGIGFADAPIARTRQAAEEGTLAITVGADDETFAAVAPLLAHCGSDITHCGPIGSGQVVKLLNNMVLIETVVALSEALAIGRAAGVNGHLLFDALSKGSADSFALRNHGIKAVLPDIFPERAFSTTYARKDLDYALALARHVGIAAKGAELADGLLLRAVERGHGDRYWPVLSRVIGDVDG